MGGVGEKGEGVLSIKGGGEGRDNIIPRNVT